MTDRDYFYSAIVLLCIVQVVLIVAVYFLYKDAYITDERIDRLDEEVLHPGDAMVRRIDQLWFKIGELESGTKSPTPSYVRYPGLTRGPQGPVDEDVRQANLRRDQGGARRDPQGTGPG